MVESAESHLKKILFELFFHFEHNLSKRLDHG